MRDERKKIFRLLETADNFVKYAKSGSEARALSRARGRYDKARKIAEKFGDDEMIEQVRLRLIDLEQISSTPADSSEVNDLEPSTVPSLEAPAHTDGRVPPGQRVLRRWPVLHVGRIPRFNPDKWSIEVNGACAQPLRFDYGEFKALPNIELVSDFHCVTGWSKLDNVWRGVQVKQLLDLAKLQPGATHLLVHAEHGYTANVPLDVLIDDDAILAWQHNGAPLAPKHGFPLRLVIPRLYAWKSVKWVRRLEILTADKRGYWEVRGYHNRADPWHEERYAYQELSNG
jgi:DMSO/TMAO reductase YedYZ molybdopterin-dependent catalytic subunit